MSALPGTVLAQAKADVGAMEALDNSRIIKADDFLSIHVLKASPEPEIIQVGSNGKIKAPYLEPHLPAAGLTCHALAFSIRRELEKAYLAGRQIVLVKFPSSLDFLDDRHLIMRGDKLSIRILEERREPDDIVVGDNGMVKIRYVGAIQAQGMTSRKLAESIRQKLISLPAFTQILAALHPLPGSESPTVAVVINNLRGCDLGSLRNRKPPSTPGPRQMISSTRALEENRIYVMGNVAKGGKYDFPTKSDLTVSGLLAKAGGHISKKQTPIIKILRQTPVGAKVILVDSHAVLVSRSQEHDLFLRPEDVILVE